MENNENNEEMRRRYNGTYDDSDYDFIMSELETRTPNQVADDNFEQALMGAKQFQTELYRQVLIARGFNPDEVDIDSLIAGETSMDETVENHKPKL